MMLPGSTAHPEHNEKKTMTTLVFLLLLLDCSGVSASLLSIDRQAVVQRHIVRLHGVGGLDPASAASFAAQQQAPCTVEGAWYDAHDTGRHDRFTVTSGPASKLCPPAGRLHGMHASTQRAWKGVPVCSYANGSLWIGRTGAHASHQTGTMDQGCFSVTWADPSPLTAQYHWCREPGTPSCRHHGPSPPPTPTPPANHPPATPQTLTVGNGVIGFNADLTGFQTLNESYQMFPLTTLSDWGWHSSPYPGTKGSPTPFETFKYTEFNISTGRDVPYPLDPTGPAGQWLRANPHRLDLIQVALRKQSAPSEPLLPVDLGHGKGAGQTLDPWTGELASNFTYGTHAISTRTSAMMDLDVLSWALEQPVRLPEPLVVRVAFPYGSSNRPGQDWGSDSKHTTTLVRQSPDSVLLKRVLDFDAYEVLCRWSDAKYHWVRDGPHSFHLAPPAEIDSDGGSGGGSDGGSAGATSIELSCLLSPPSARYPIDPSAGWLMTKSAQTRALLQGQGDAVPVLLPLYDAVAADAATGWKAFWESGAFVDLGTTEARAIELERRVVLSQYLTRSQSAGSTPPQETGYTLNSWYGKFHHESELFALKRCAYRFNMCCHVMLHCSPRRLLQPVRVPYPPHAVVDAN